MTSEQAKTEWIKHLRRAHEYYINTASASHYNGAAAFALKELITTVEHEVERDAWILEAVPDK